MPLEFENMTQDFTYCKYERIMVCCLFGIAGYQVLNHDTQAVSTLSVFLIHQIVTICNVGTPVFVH